MSKILNGKIAIITGGSGLLGSEFARTLALEGVKVWILDVQTPSKDITKLITGFIPTDISKPKDVKVAVRKIVQFNKSIDILVNCAALTSETGFKLNHGFFNKFENYPLKLWKKALNINLTGMFLVCQEVSKIMVKQKRGVIVNMASNYGMVAPDFRTYEGCINPKTGQPFTSPVSYTTSKGAVLSFTKYLACYLGPKGIRVNSLSPSGVKTDMDKKFIENYTRNIPLGRMAQKDEYNKAILFLVSDASKFMTGSNLVIDGGWTAW